MHEDAPKNWAKFANTAARPGELTMSKDEKQSARPPGHLEREETKLWRLALLFLVLLATGLAALSWERLENLPYHLGLIPVGLLVMAILFATYAYGRRREVSELKHLLESGHPSLTA